METLRPRGGISIKDLKSKRIYHKVIVLDEDLIPYLFRKRAILVSHQDMANSKIFVVLFGKHFLNIYSIRFSFDSFLRMLFILCHSIT